MEVERTAIIDRAGPARRPWSVVLPLVRPALITVAIISDLAALNLGIARLSAGSSRFLLKLALASLSTLPIAIVYVFVSRYFTRSIATTGIK